MYNLSVLQNARIWSLQAAFPQDLGHPWWFGSQGGPQNLFNLEGVGESIFTMETSGRSHLCIDIVGNKECQFTEKLLLVDAEDVSNGCASGRQETTAVDANRHQDRETGNVIM